MAAHDQLTPVDLARERLRDQDTITVYDAAPLLGFGAGAVRQAVSRGEMPSIRLGRNIRIPSAYVRRVLEGQGPAAEEEPVPEPEWNAEDIRTMEENAQIKGVYAAARSAWKTSRIWVFEEESPEQLFVKGFVAGHYLVTHPHLASPL